MYTPEYYYWEVIELFRKLFLCGVLQFVQPGSGTQIVICIAFTTIYASLFSYCSPLKERSDVLLEVCSELEIFSVAFAALLIKLNLTEEEKHDAAAFDAVLVTLMLLPFLLFVGAVIFAFTSSLMGTQYLGFEFTKRLYPGILSSFGTYLKDGRTVTKVRFNDNESRRMVIAPRLFKTLRKLRKTINQNNAAKHYSEISEVLIQRCNILENTWHKMSKEGRLQKGDIRVWRDWLSRLCDAYHNIMRNFHDRRLALSYVARLREIVKEERVSLFISSRHESIMNGDDRPSTDYNDWSNAALDAVNRVTEKTRKIKKQVSSKIPKSQQKASPRSKFFKDIEAGDDDDNADELSLSSEEDDRRRPQAIGHAVKRTRYASDFEEKDASSDEDSNLRSKSRQVYGEDDDVHASTSSIDLDKVVEDGYDDEKYDNDNEDVFDGDVDDGEYDIKNDFALDLDKDDDEKEKEENDDEDDDDDTTSEFNLDDTDYEEKDDETETVTEHESSEEFELDKDMQSEGHESSEGDFELGRVQV